VQSAAHYACRPAVSFTVGCCRHRRARLELLLVVIQHASNSAACDDCMTAAALSAASIVQWQLLLQLPSAQYCVHVHGCCLCAPACLVVCGCQWPQPSTAWGAAGVPKLAHRQQCRWVLVVTVAASSGVLCLLGCPKHMHACFTRGALRTVRL
jgi:hypothetical protein